MILFRPWAPSYEQAMQQLRFFADVPEMSTVLTKSYNITNYLGHIPFFCDLKEISDARNGWQHTRLLYFYGTDTLIGACDLVTLADYKAPKFTFYQGEYGGYECKFSFQDRKYHFVLAVDTWSDTSQCLGYINSNLIYREDNVSVDRKTFFQILTNFVIDKAFQYLKAKSDHSST